MGDRTSIEWTDHTFNPWIGCMKVSPGCANCYARNETFPRVQRSRGRELWGPASTTDRHRTAPANWRQPLKWNAQAEAEGRRRRVFCASMSDVFEDHPALAPWRWDLWELIEETPWLDWQLLTKRPENIRRMYPRNWLDENGPPPNVWLGTSAEDQQRLDERLRYLLGVPAVVTFLSCEPLLGELDLSWWAVGEHEGTSIDWVIVGGESGPGARPFHVAWARTIRDDCRRYGIAYFLKQLGAHPWDGETEWPEGQRCPVPVRLHDRKGSDMAEWPEDLRVRQFPMEVARG